MTSSQFDLGSTSKTLNLSLLRFNERSGFQNLVQQFDHPPKCQLTLRGMQSALQRLDPKIWPPILFFFFFFFNNDFNSYLMNF